MSYRPSRISTAPSPARFLFVVFCALILAAIAAVTAARAAAPEDTKPQDSGTGRLFFRGDTNDSFVPAPLVATDVKIAVSGMVARATVTQHFRNEGDRWLEGVYVFPLPEGSAVDRMRLKIGEKLVEGRIEEKQQAQRTYEQARAQGQRAGLVEQERPNVFTTSLANIGPKETITVEIEYQESLRYDQGKFGLRFPLVVGPRYIPGHPLIASTRGWSPVTTAVADADRITPPVRKPSEGLGNPVTMSVSIDAGMKLAGVTSASHKIVTTPGERDRVTVTLADKEVPADRDFELSWAPEVGANPRAGLFVEERNGQRHLLLMVMPPDAAAPEGPRLPREAIFIIDTSGSMEGASIAQAKAALRLALDRLTPADRFNIIQFNSTASALFAKAQPADAETLRMARGYVDYLKANGGTEMAPALDLALDSASDPARMRQLMFITDGLVGNEAALLPIIQKRLGDSRMFTVAIGSAPNQWFMTRAARAGRGTFTNIARIEEVQQRMSALFEKLEKPVLTDLAVQWPAGAQAEFYPDPLPDLYAGEPVVFTARLPAGALPAGATATISGKRAGQAWRETLALDSGADSAGVGALWARSKLERLSETQKEGESADTVRAASLEVALGYGLVSRYTSLVAVDVTPARPANTDLHSTQVPTNLPDGMVHDAIFGERSKMLPGSAPGQQPTGLPPVRHAMAAPTATVGGAPAAQQVALPQGATAAELHALIGMALLMMAGVLALIMRNRRV